MLAALILGLGLGVGTEISESCEITGSVGYDTHGARWEAELLGHFYGWNLYDRYFGYSSFDPFITIGAKGWIANEGAVGPKTGLGAFYHLDDHWSLRADADATLAVNRKAAVLFSLSLGVQYSF